MDSSNIELIDIYVQNRKQWIDFYKSIDRHYAQVIIMLVVLLIFNTWLVIFNNVIINGESIFAPIQWFKTIGYNKIVLTKILESQFFKKYEHLYNIANSSISYKAVECEILLMKDYMTDFSIIFSKKCDQNNKGNIDKYLKRCQDHVNRYVNNHAEYTIQDNENGIYPLDDVFPFHSSRIIPDFQQLLYKSIDSPPRFVTQFLLGLFSLKDQCYIYSDYDIVYLYALYSLLLISQTLSMCKSRLFLFRNFLVFSFRNSELIKSLEIISVGYLIILKQLSVESSNID